MVSIILCDDNEILLNKYKSEVSKLLDIEKIVYNIQTFTSGESLLFYMEEKENDIDIIYLDIKMDKITGIEVAEKLRHRGFMGEIIFLTCCKEAVFECFDVNPFHYIVKEAITGEKFKNILLKAVSESLKKDQDYFTFENHGITKRIALKSISYFEVKNRIVTVNYDNTCVDFYSTMDKIQKKLDGKYFIRCHRSYMVNLKHIREIRWDLLLTLDGYTIPIGKTYTKDVHSAFSDMLSDF